MKLNFIRLPGGVLESSSEVVIEADADDPRATLPCLAAIRFNLRLFSLKDSGRSSVDRFAHLVFCGYEKVLSCLYR